MAAQLNEHLFDPTAVFQFYSKSTDKPSPGLGAGERITEANKAKYHELASIKGWRKVLSNFYMASFELDGKTWNSVEHFYQANKFKKRNPKFYYQFTVESDSEISKNPAIAKGAGGKTGKFKGQQIRPKNVVMDHDFFSYGRNEEVMERAQMAKYIQNEKARQVLLATNDAKLQHFVRGHDSVVFYNTMRVRQKLRQ
eukprot:Seg2284.6 transcript_id=Seg2284.6/GoldUCD/mRNA.D3Y31 product="N-glycosidase YbiA" protein_id=Seg2284.6/GoldUCD/D3Y31